MSQNGQVLTRILTVRNNSNKIIDLDLFWSDMQMD